MAAIALARRLTPLSMHSCLSKTFITSPRPRYPPRIIEFYDPKPEVWAHRYRLKVYLYHGVNFRHWRVAVVEPPKGLTSEELISSYVEIVAKVLGSVRGREEASSHIYSISTSIYLSFGVRLPEMLISKLKAMEGVETVFPDSYWKIDAKDYGGVAFEDGVPAPYNSHSHDSWALEMVKGKGAPRYGFMCEIFKLEDGKWLFQDSGTIQNYVPKTPYDRRDLQHVLMKEKAGNYVHHKWLQACREGRHPFERSDFSNWLCWTLALGPTFPTLRAQLTGLSALQEFMGLPASRWATQLAATADAATLADQIKPMLHSCQVILNSREAAQNAEKMGECMARLIMCRDVLVDSKEQGEAAKNSEKQEERKAKINMSEKLRVAVKKLCKVFGWGEELD